MARINLEDDFFKPQKLEAVAVELGINVYEVAGRLAFLFHTAINELKPEVPSRELALWMALPVSKSEAISKILEDAGWVKSGATPGHWEIRGVRKHMGWLEDKRKAASAGGQARAANAERDQSGRLLPSSQTPATSQADAKQEPGKVLPSSSPLVLTPVLVPAPVISQNEDSLRGSAPENPGDTPPVEEAESSPQRKRGRKSKPNGVGTFIAAYKTAFRDRPGYGTYPPLAGKDIGTAKRLVEFLGVERAVQLVQVYLGMNNAWYVTKRHDLVTLEQNLNDVAIMADTGRTITQKQAQESERQSANIQAVKAYQAMESKQ